MAFSVNNIVFLGIFLVHWSGFGSAAVRIVSYPQPFSDITDELNISCITDGPSLLAKSIVSIQIMTESEETIAVLNMRQELKMGAGSKNNMKAEGHVDTADARKSRFILTIEKPKIEDAGIYRCLVFFTDESFKIFEESATGNVTYQKSGITGTVKKLAQKVASLFTSVQEQNKTIQTQKKQHQTFTDTHSEQKQDIDNLTDELDRQNNKDAKLTERIHKQNAIITKQSKQIDTLNKDNTKKQQQLDMLIDYIKQQREMILIHGIELDNLNERVCRDEGWTYYKEDKSCLKVFAKDDDSSKFVSWTKARELCQSFGGDLVQIRDEDKNKFVNNMLEGASRLVWIGIKNKAIRGFNFKYVDGTDLGNYHPWNTGQPTSDGEKDGQCVYMSTSKTNRGKWNEDSCSLPLSYVCSSSISSLSA